MTTAQAFEDIVANYSDSFNLLLEQPFSYLWKYTDMLSNVGFWIAL